MTYKIKVYATANGKCPFAEWLKKLADKQAAAAVVLRIERLEMGNMGDCKALGHSLYELKINCGPGYRIYFGKIGLRIILLLCAGKKQTQQKDIEKAKQYFEDFKTEEASK